MEQNKKVLSICEKFNLTIFMVLRLIIVFKIKSQKVRCNDRSSVTDYRHKYSLLDIIWYDYNSLVHLVKNTDFFNDQKASSEVVICHFENSIYSILHNNGVFISPKDVPFHDNSIGFSLYDERLKRTVIGFIYFFNNLNDEVKYFFSIDTKKTNKMQHIWSVLKLKPKPTVVHNPNTRGPPSQIARVEKREEEIVIPVKKYKFDQWFEDTCFSKMKFEELTDDHISYLFSVLQE